MDITTALRTNGSVRGFTPEPVSDAVVAAHLDDARFAPSGGNQQPWRVAVVKDAAVRRQMADHMRPVWQEYMGAQQAGKRAFAFGKSTGDAPIAVPNALIDQIEAVPVVLAIAADLRKIAIMDGNQDQRPAIVGGASIYPFCWSILLAAKARGLGGVLTTFLSRAEQGAALSPARARKHPGPAEFHWGNPPPAPAPSTMTRSIQYRPGQQPQPTSAQA